MDWMPPDEILTRAHDLLPELVMGSKACIEWKKAIGSCQGCPAHEYCRFFTIGFLVAAEYAFQGIKETLISLTGK